LDAAKWEFEQDHRVLGVTAISAEVVLAEKQEI
jgi:hypothetical protein